MSAKPVTVTFNGETDHHARGYVFLAAVLTGPSEFTVLGFNAGKREFATYVGRPGNWNEGRNFSIGDNEANDVRQNAYADFAERAGLVPALA